MCPMLPMQAFINKHDYARLHSYEFLSKPVLPDPAAPGTWYRLLLLKQVPVRTAVPAPTR